MSTLPDYDTPSDYYFYCFVGENRTVKIGYTWNVELRRKRLQRQRRTHLRIHSVIKVHTSRREIHALEQETHKFLRASIGIHSRSEWYPYSEKLLDKLQWITSGGASDAS